jgi:hypothetical protein
MIGGFIWCVLYVLENGVLNEVVFLYNTECSMLVFTAFDNRPVRVWFLPLLIIALFEFGFYRCC